MTNKYLEKLASTALQRNFAAGKLTSVTGVDRSGGKMGAAALNKAVTGTTQTGSVYTPNARTRQTATGSTYRSFADKPMGSRSTTDALASQPSLRDRLVTHKQNVVNGKAGAKPLGAAGSTGILNKAKSIAGKAMGLAKKNPLIAGAGALIGVGAAASKMRNKDNDSSY